MSKFQHFNFYLLRSPLLSLENISSFLELQDPSAQEIHLRSLYSSNLMQEALFLSSPNLYNEVQKWLTSDTALTYRQLATLYKYTVRSGTRSTPYGLFAGVSPGTISKLEKQTEIARNSKDMTRYRLDMQYLSLMLQHISNDTAVKPRLKFSVNCTLFRNGDIHKFYQQQFNFKGESTYNLRAVRSTPILEYLIQKCTSDMLYQNFVDLLKQKGANESQARDFVDKMIKNGILDSELSVQITTDNFYEALVTRLESADCSRKYLPLFQKIDRLLKLKINLIHKQLKIENLTRKAFPGIISRNVIQGDLLLGMKENTISKRGIEGIIKELGELLPLVTHTNNYEIEQFKTVFRERYDSQMVPLLEALDPDNGIGYGRLAEYIQPDNIINEIKTNAQSEKSKKKSIGEQILEKHLKLYATTEVVLTEADIESAGCTFLEKNVPPTLYVMGNLLYNNKNDNELVFCLQSLGGSSATNLLTRFAHLDDEIRKNVLEIANFEERAFPNDAIIAEIVHLPEARIGNILQRPNLRKAEIPVMARSHNNAQKLDVDDLYIFLKNERLVLWSKKLDREVIPRLSSAHNFKTGMILYRFLADMQSQYGELNLKIDWCSLEKSPFHPRIRYKNIILRRAQWNIPKINHSSSSNYDDIQTVLQTYNLPQIIMVSEGDNELLIDLSNPLSCRILFDKLCKQDVVLKEYIFSQFRSAVSDNTATYGNEIILPLATDTIETKPTVRPAIALTIERKFPPGSEWVYAKIYCGASSAEYLLKEIIPGIVDTLNRKLLIKKWFFVRYTDPQHHIRLRIEACQKEDFCHIVSVINNTLSKLLKNQKIYNLQFDTYIRELERYGPETIEDSEELFHLDSLKVLSIIDKYPEISERWLPASRRIVDYLTTAGMDVEEKLRFIEDMRRKFFLEFGNDKQNDKILNLKYRDRRKTIEHTLSSVNTVSKEESIVINSIINSLWDSYEDRDQVLIRRQSLLASYIHMFVNRLFEKDQRKYEYALYHLLSNYFRSLKGRIAASSSSRCQP